MKPGPGGGPPQPAGQLHVHEVVLHVVPPGHPPQSGKHVAVHERGSQVWPAGGPPGMPQSAGQMHCELTHTNGAAHEHACTPPLSSIQYL